MDHRPFLRTRDSVERLVEAEIGRQLLEEREQRDVALAKAIAAHTGNRVGTIVARALSEALRSIARAMAARR